MGKWGRRLITEFANASEVVRCANRTDAGAAQWLAQHLPGTRHTVDVQELMADSDIDAVIIATPIPTHARLAWDALRAGKHVFVEKPLATTVSECDKAIEAAKSADRQLFVGHTFLYDSGLQTLFERTRDDPLRELAITWHKFGTFDEPLIWNLLTHDVAVTTWLLGTSVFTADVTHAAGTQTRLDRLEIVLEAADGARSRVEIDRTRPTRVRTLSARTASGRAYRWSPGHLEALHAAGSWETVHTATVTPLEREVEAFLAACTTGQSAVSDGAFARHVTEVVSRIGRRLDAADAVGPARSAGPQS